MKIKRPDGEIFKLSYVYFNLPDKNHSLPRFIFRKGEVIVNLRYGLVGAEDLERWSALEQNFAALQAAVIECKRRDGDGDDSTRVQSLEGWRYLDSYEKEHPLTVNVSVMKKTERKDFKNRKRARSASSLPKPKPAPEAKRLRRPQRTPVGASAAAHSLVTPAVLDVQLDAFLASLVPPAVLTTTLAALPSPVDALAIFPDPSAASADRRTAPGSDVLPK